MEEKRGVKYAILYTYVPIWTNILTVSRAEKNELKVASLGLIILGRDWKLLFNIKDGQENKYKKYCGKSRKK